MAVPNTDATAGALRRRTRRRNKNRGDTTGGQAFGDMRKLGNGGVDIHITRDTIRRIAKGVTMGKNWTPDQLQQQIGLCLGVDL
jgi:hypothetical protein